MGLYKNAVYHILQPYGSILEITMITAESEVSLSIARHKRMRDIVAILTVLAAAVTVLMYCHSIAYGALWTVITLGMAALTWHLQRTLVQWVDFSIHTQEDGIELSDIKFTDDITQ